MPVTSAFRADISGHSEVLDDRVTVWLTVASLLEHAAILRDAEALGPFRRAVEMVHHSLERAFVIRASEDEWGETDPGSAEAVLLLAEQMENAGMLKLAAATQSYLLGADRTLSLVQQGRVLAQRARVASKQAYIDEARDRYIRLDRLGRSAGSDELRARAAIGLGALAQMRGNYPELRRLARRALRFAEPTPIRALLRHAHAGLMIAAAISGALDEALAHGWEMYTVSVGDDRREAEVLQNLGQALLDAGQPALARAAFSVVVSRELEARVMLPALGGLALASAATGRKGAVDWAVEQVRRVNERAVPRYALASALLECAVALARVGSPVHAQAFRARAMQLGEAHGFHEVVIRAERLQRVAPDLGARRSITGERAASAARALAEMEPGKLPESVSIAIAG